MLPKRLLWLLFLSLVFLSVCILLAGIGWSGFRLRPSPTNASQELFQGIDYIRETRSSPRRQIIHIVRIDLRMEGIRFLVTPGDPEAENPLKARLTSEFLDEFGLQVAINGDGVTPWWSHNVFDYYPHRGDPVDPIGLAASRGVIYSSTTDDEPTLYISRTNQANFYSPRGKIENAISGNLMLVKNGEKMVSQNENPQPRTAVALDRRNRQLILILVDGRQPGYSEGATLSELADLILEFGGNNGMNLDGGGSTTLVIEDQDGTPRILNSPIDNQIPGRERPVGNHLGIYAEKINEK